MLEDNHHRKVLVSQRFAAIVLAAHLATFRTGQESNVANQDALLFAPTAVTLDARRCFLGGTIRAGDFFLSLKKVRSGNGLKFRKGSAFVESFPSRLDIIITIGGVPNEKESFGGDPSLAAELSPEVMDSLTFQAHWKRSMQLRPVDTLSVTEHFQDSHNIWIYKMTVSSKDVPLTDHLIISVFAKDGKRIARLSAGL